MRRKTGHAENIADVALFAGLTPKELDHVDTLLTEIRLRAGEVLVREGEPGRECFIVAEGTASARLRGKTIGSIGAGSVVGEMALLDGGPRTATVVAESPMRVFVLDPGSFHTLIIDHPHVGRKIMGTLTSRLRVAEKAPGTAWARRAAVSAF